MGREIKKSVVVAATQNIPRQIPHQKQRERERSREGENKGKEAEVEEISAANRRDLLRRMREREEEQDNNDMSELPHNTSQHNQLPAPTLVKIQYKVNEVEASSLVSQPSPDEPEEKQETHSSDESGQEDVVLHKPVFVGKQERETLRIQDTLLQKVTEQHSKKMKIGRQNTKLLLNETLKAEGEEEGQVSDSDSDHCEMPDDDDTKEQGIEYEYWKIRELKRIRRDREDRNKFSVLQADVERRRKMTDQQRLAENKRLGSDLTDNTESTKYVFMQKYWNKGAFFQDSEDAVMKRNYNLPTAMELQDKTMLPKILQKRRNDFGKKGQSKYTHLADVDTTNHDPRTKANQTVMIALQKKMAGYKDSFLQTKR